MSNFPLIKCLKKIILEIHHSLFLVLKTMTVSLPPYEMQQTTRDYLSQPFTLKRTELPFPTSQQIHRTASHDPI